jgi:6-phosphogluconolactonase
MPSDSRAADFVYVSVGEKSVIAIYKLDLATGALTPSGEVNVGGAPGALAVDAKQKFLYAAIRSAKSVMTLAIDPTTGGLSSLGTAPVAENPVYLMVDRSGRYLLTSYYGAAKAAIYPIEKSGAVNSAATSIVETDKNPHSIMVDRSNRFVFVPNTGADKVLQYRFNADRGTLTPNEPAEFATGVGTGPRHFYFHPTSNYVYFVNEKGSSVTATTLDRSAGTLAMIETTSTLPDGYAGKNTCAHIEVHPSGKFLYGSNRGHDSIACYSIDAATGKLTSLGQQPTEATPRAFTIDPSGNFLFAAGQASGKLAAYRINTTTGKLEPLAVYSVGKGPAWVLALRM